MKLGLLMGTALAVLATSIPANADDIEYYRHNGSIIQFEWYDESGEAFEGTYYTPRANLRIEPGTVLIHGTASASG